MLKKHLENLIIAMIGTFLVLIGAFSEKMRHEGELTKEKNLSCRYGYIAAAYHPANKKSFIPKIVKDINKICEE